jgi:hypothetical protein
MSRPDNVTGAWRKLSFTDSDHESILQTLERASNGLYLPLDAYKPTVGDWAGIPLIYVEKSPAEHPNPEAYDQDPRAELERIGGRLVGQCLDAWIDMVGHPKLRGRLGVDDPEVDNGIDNGKISLSTGLRNLRPKGDRLTEPARPHHILLFREGGRDQPGDKGAFILNTETDTDETLFAKFKAFLKGAATGEAGTGDRAEEKEMADIKELEGKLATREQELAQANLAYTQLQTKMAEMGEAVKAKDAEIAGLRTEKLAFIAKEQDAKWGAFKSKHIPPGMVAGDKEKEARKEFEADPLTFMEKVLEFREQHPVDSGDGAEGAQFTAGPARQKKVKFEDELRAVGVPCISFSGIEEGK